MNPILKRIITALSVLSSIVAALILFNQYVSPDLTFKIISPILILLICLVQLEFYQMISRRYEVMPICGVLLGLGFLIGTVYYNLPIAGLLLLTFFVLAVLILLNWTDKALEKFATTLFGLIYIPVFLLPLIGFLELSPLHLLFAIFIIKASDMGGFALGVSFGRHKLCPNISPKKSWEGLLGSVIASFLAILIFTSIFPNCISSDLTIGCKILLSIGCAVTGTLGDLIESRIKRECKVKDSATFMPAGMGGFLDMFDSLVFALPFIYGFRVFYF